ncbi:MAG: hypothetical protein KGL55_12315 [Rhodospirillales bacterium]|nr:hypothetical protein [Rhodospirillales bacterium]
MTSLRAFAIGTAAIAGLLALQSAPARADGWRDGWHPGRGHWEHRGEERHWGPPPVYYAPPPVYYAPRAYYVAPPPAYYAPPPVAYVNPGISVGLGFNFR